MTKLIQLTIDDREIVVPEGMTIIQAAMQNGCEVPHFCFHSRLKIAGNCRMCLVEIEKQPKLAASCAMPVAEGMVVHTRTDRVKKAREGVLEFLLINHPLDCPICDQGGECDLQDITLNYGRDHGRYRERKRAVAPKSMGPIIKTHMNRCIHCTRCVRFAEDVAAMPEMGTLNRGEEMEITTYLNHAVKSELSGNMVDLCPVGALTSAPYAFRGRPWELQHTDSIDVMDALGSHVRIDTFANRVMRILPRTCDEINEDWLTDKARFAAEGLEYQRLSKPLVRKNDTFEELTWPQALVLATEKLSRGDAKQKAALAGDLLDVEALFALKNLWNAIESPHIDARQNASLVSHAHRSHYLFNATIQGVDEADLILIIGDDLRHAAPLLHARLQTAVLERNTPIYHLGTRHMHAMPYLFAYTHLGSTTDILSDLLEGVSQFAKTVREAKRPMMILCEDVLCCEEALSIQALCQQIATRLGFVRQRQQYIEWNGYCVVTAAASRVAALDLAVVPQKGGWDSVAIVQAAAEGRCDCLLLVGADEIHLTPSAKTFVIYVGHHGDRGASIADLILPCAAWSEKESTYVSLEGRVQRAHTAVNPREGVPPEWHILGAIREIITQQPNWASLENLRQDIATHHAHLMQQGIAACDDWIPLPEQKKWDNIDLARHHDRSESYFLNNPLARHSKTMRACFKEHQGERDV